MFSGVLYLQVDNNTGDIVFLNLSDTRNNLIPSDYNIFNSREWRYTPTNGLLLFFLVKCIIQCKKINQTLLGIL